MIIKLLVDAGDMKPGPNISQKLGPLGINIGKVISSVNQATAHLEGMKIPVELDVNAKTKEFNIKVSMPPVSELLKKEIGIEKGSGNKEIKVGNIAIEQIIAIAKSKINEMLVKDLKAAVKTVVGSCVSLGILIENKEAKTIEKEIDEGKYDGLIKEGKTSIEPEKKKKLEEFFSQIKIKQEMMLKKAEEKRAAEVAEKEKAATPAARETKIEKKEEQPAKAAAKEEKVPKSKEK